MLLDWVQASEIGRIGVKILPILKWLRVQEQHDRDAPTHCKEQDKALSYQTWHDSLCQKV
jgi:hypothetical protein